MTLTTEEPFNDLSNKNRKRTGQPPQTLRLSTRPGGAWWPRVAWAEGAWVAEGLSWVPVETLWGV